MPGRLSLPGSVLTCLLSLASANAGDWPQILGPNRNAIAIGEKLPDSLSEQSLKAAWKTKAGTGLAGVAVQGPTVVLFHRRGDDEVVTALNASTGKSQWEQRFPTNFQASINPDDGPRCVPVISGQTIVLLGAAGTLAAVDFESGKKLWQHDLQKEFQAPTGYFGFGTTPLVHDGRVLVNVGGERAGAGVVAFDLKTGKVQWKVGRELGSYSAPAIAAIGGQPTALVVTRLNFLGLDPATGKERFRTPFGARGPTVNAATPVISGDRVLLTASYGIGAKLLQVTPTSVDTVWENEILSSQYTTPIWHDGAVYGIDGRQDAGAVSLKCFEPSTRKIFWEVPNLSDYATLIAADGKLLIFSTGGDLRVARLQTTKYEELGRARVGGVTTRALPALANGQIYVRDGIELHAWKWAAE